MMDSIGRVHSHGFCAVDNGVVIDMNHGLSTGPDSIVNDSIEAEPAGPGRLLHVSGHGFLDRLDQRLTGIRTVLALEMLIMLPAYFFAILARGYTDFRVIL